MLHTIKWQLINVYNIILPFTSCELETERLPGVLETCCLSTGKRSHCSPIQPFIEQFLLYLLFLHIQTAIEFIEVSRLNINSRTFIQIFESFIWILHFLCPKHQLWSHRNLLWWSPKKGYILSTSQITNCLLLAN